MTKIVFNLNKNNNIELKLFKFDYNITYIFVLEKSNLLFKSQSVDKLAKKNCKIKESFASKT